MQIIQITETNVDTPCGNPAVYEHQLFVEVNLAG